MARLHTLHAQQTASHRQTAKQREYPTNVVQRTRLAASTTDHVDASVAATAAAVAARSKKKKTNRVCNTHGARARTWQQVRQLTAEMHEENSRHEIFHAAEQLFVSRIHAPHRKVAGEELATACSALYRASVNTRRASASGERSATAVAKATCHCNAILNERKHQRTLRMVSSHAMGERLRHDAHAPTICTIRSFLSINRCAQSCARS